MATTTNLLVNGSFEDTPQAAGTWAAYNSIPGWTALSTGMIETWNAYPGEQHPLNQFTGEPSFWHSHLPASQGLNFVELDYAGGRDGFFQDVSTEAGKVYDLTFDARAREGFDFATQRVEIVWNGAVVGSMTPELRSWSQQFFKVTGTGGNDRLTIREAASTSGDGAGILLDNFSLTETQGAATKPPVVRLATDPSISEGQSGATTFNFTLLRSGDLSGTTSVEYVVNGSGPFPANVLDFVGGVNPRGEVAFAPGEYDKTIMILVQGDTVGEPNEAFNLTLINPTDGGVRDGSGILHTGLGGIFA